MARPVGVASSSISVRPSGRRGSAAVLEISIPAVPRLSNSHRCGPHIVGLRGSGCAPSAKHAVLRTRHTAPGTAYVVLSTTAKCHVLRARRPAITSLSRVGHVRDDGVPPAGNGEVITADVVLRRTSSSEPCSGFSSRWKRPSKWLERTFGPPHL